MRADDFIRKLAAPVALAGLLLLFVALGTLLVQGRLTATVGWLFAAAVLMFVFFLAADPEHILSWLRGRQARYGTNAAVMSVSFIGVLILVNFLASSHSQLWDVTASHRFTLSPQSIKVLQSLKQPVTMTAFYANSGPGNSGKRSAKQLLDQYAAHSHEVTVKFVDPDQQPGIAQQFNVRAYGTVVVQSGTKKQTVEFGTERDYTSAIIRVTSSSVAKLYFLTGHGEPSITGASNTGLQQFADALKKVGDEVAPLSLASGGQVPADAAGVVIAAPQKQLLPNEVQALQQYLARGGHLLALSQAYPKVHLSALLSPYGMTLDSGIVVDVAQNLQNVPVAPGIVQYPTSPITQNLQGLQTFFPDSTAVIVKTPAPTGVQLTPFLRTTTQSWESKSTDRTNLNFNSQTDVRGPIDIGVLATKTMTPAATATAAATPTPTAPAATAPAAKETRIVVISDLNWVTNQYFSALGNQDLALAAANWVAAQDQLVNIPPPPAQNHSLFLSGVSQNLLFFGNFLFVPAIVLLAGFSVWFRRR